MSQKQQVQTEQNQQQKLGNPTLLSMCGSCHIQNILIGVEYQNCCQTLDVYLLVAISIGKIQYNFVLGGTSPGKISRLFLAKNVNMKPLEEAMNEFKMQAKNWTETLNHTGQFFSESFLSLKRSPFTTSSSERSIVMSNVHKKIVDF